MPDIAGDCERQPTTWCRFKFPLPTIHANNSRTSCNLLYRCGNRKTCIVNHEARRRGGGIGMPCGDSTGLFRPKLILSIPSERQ